LKRFIGAPSTKFVRSDAVAWVLLSIFRLVFLEIISIFLGHDLNLVPWQYGIWFCDFLRLPIPEIYRTPPDLDWFASFYSL
jgi:hypothetical protein